MIVLDASAAVEWLLGLPLAGVVEQRLLGGEIAAPALLFVEVAQVVRRHVLRGAVTPARGAQALDALLDLRMTTDPHEPLLGRVWALRDVASAYDAISLALAEALDAPLVTTDARLARAPGHQAVVDLLG